MRMLEILVVDDEELVGNAAKTIMERLGHKVTVVSSGEATLELLRLDNKKFDLVLVDLQMGGIDGIETIRQAKDIARPDTVFWLWTSDANDKIVTRAYQTGARFVIAKPARLEVIKGLIEETFKDGE